MIITCKNCKTSYHIARKNIEGKQLRCSKCKHQWVYKGKDFVSKVKHDTLYLTAIKSTKPKFKLVSLWIFLFPIFLVIVMIGVSMVFFQNFWRKHVPMMIPYYESAGAYSTEGCVLHSTYAVKVDAGIVINGIVENASNVKRKIPALLVSVSYRNVDKPQKFLIAEQPVYLGPEEKYFFNQQITPVGSVEKISVEIMSGFEIVFYKLFDR